MAVVALVTSVASVAVPPPGSAVTEGLMVFMVANMVATGVETTVVLVALMVVMPVERAMLMVELMVVALTVVVMLV